MNHCLLGLSSALVVASVLGACSDTGSSPDGSAGSGADAGEGPGGSSGKGNAGANQSGGASAGAGTGGEGNVGEGGTTPTSGGNAGANQSGGQSGQGEGGQGGNVSTTFILGADISSTQEVDYTYVDVDGTEKPLLELLKDHGFNYVRLRTFVDPLAPYGYAASVNGCKGTSEAFGDRDHVVAYGKKVKEAGMGFLLDFHYSDTWADPGKQIIPEAWRDAATVTDLAVLAKAYTKDVITTAIAAGARPDMVQVGNEITPGMMAHVPGSSTDCWGNKSVNAPFGGASGGGNWANLALLLKAGIEGVREVDPTIQIMLHIENTDDLGGVRWWVDNALANNVSFDVLGLSCYVAYQQQPGVWRTTFNDIAKRYPTLKFAIAEYNEERTQANMIMKELPNGRGLGTFFWEPTRSGSWGPALLDVNDDTATADEAAFAEFDALRPKLGL